MEAKEKLDQLKKQGARIFSFSKLGSFSNCEYEYYKTYVEKTRGIDNVYTLLGSLLHDNIEGIYKGDNSITQFKKNYEDKLMEMDIVGVNFPNEKIGDSWKKDVEHFLANFKKIDRKTVLEKLIVFEIADGIWLQGYIDAIMPSEKGKPYVDIFDWKTSSKFTGKKLTEAGRQLLMYKVGLEATSDFKVDSVQWFMIKYVNVCSKFKNGNVKSKMCNRGKWVKEIKSQLEKDMHNLGIEEFELEMLLDKAIQDNNLDSLPRQVRDKYWLEDCVVVYEITDEKIEELKQYILNTIAEIDSKDPKNEDDWKPIEIDKSNSFYCSVLCGHRKTCKYYKKFLEENADSFDKKNKKDEFDLFS